MTTSRAAFCLPVLLLVIGCARAQPETAPRMACPSPLQPMVRADLYTDKSNRSAQDGRLTDAEWKSFVEQVLIKHFPSGGTVLENTGWWRRPNGTTFHGTGRTLIMLSPISELETHRAGARAVIDEIKKRYGPSSVGWEENFVCAAF